MKLDMSKRRKIVSFSALVVVGLFLAAQIFAQDTEQVPTDWSNQNIQTGIQNSNLIIGINAYTSGNYVEALENFQSAAKQLKGDIAQELQVKIALCHLFLKDIEKGQTLLESIRENSAGGRGGWHADSMLKRLSRINNASEIERDSMLRAEYLLSIGDIQSAHKEYLSLVESGRDDKIKDFAQQQATILEATELILHRRFDEVPSLVKNNLKSLKSPHTIWPAVLEIAEIANSRADGDIDEVYAKIEKIENFVNQWESVDLPDESTKAHYHYLLSNLNMHRLLYANQLGSGKDSWPPLEAALSHLETALEHAKNPPSYLQSAIIGDLVDVHLMANHFRTADKLAKSLYQEFPSSPVLPSTWLKMGIVNMNIGNHDKAREWFIGLLLLFPGTKEAIQANSFLQNELLERSEMIFDDTISQKPLESKDTSSSIPGQASTEKSISTSTEHEEEGSSQPNVKSSESFVNQASGENSISTNKKQKGESSSRWGLWIIIIVVLTCSTVAIWLTKNRSKERR